MERLKSLSFIEDLFQVLLKMQPEVTEAVKISQLHAFLRKKLLQTVTIISATHKKTLGDVLFAFPLKYLKPESQATAKHGWHKVTFDSKNTKMSLFKKNSVKLPKERLVVTPRPC